MKHPKAITRALFKSTQPTASGVHRWIQQVTALLLALGLCATGLLGQTAQTPDSGYVPALLQQGSPDNAYALTNLYSMNYFTGRLSVSIPLRTIKGRGDTNIPIAAVFQRDLTVQQTSATTNCPTQPCYSLSVQHSSLSDVNIFAGLMELKQADTLVWNAMTNGYTTSRLYFYRSDGSSTELVDTQYYGQPVLSQCHMELNSCPTLPVVRGNSFVSTDGSQLRFIADQPIQDQITWSGHSPVGSASPSGYLIFRDGTKYRVQGGMDNHLGSKRKCN